jgi:hypothetical protein
MNLKKSFPDFFSIDYLLISALKSKLFPAEDRHPKNVVFG